MLQVKKTTPKIKDIMTPTDAVFSKMNYDFEFIEKEKLDIIFVTSYGERIIAPFVDYFLEHDVNSNSFTFSEESKQLLSDTVLAYYKVNWDKLKQIIKTEYDPIHNFSDKVTENFTDRTEKTIATNDTVNDIGTGSKTRTDNLVLTETRNLAGTQNDDSTLKMQGFNSTSFQDKDKDVSIRNTTDTGTISNENTGTQENSETRNFTTTKTGNETTNDQYTRERNLSRLGNIGNITTQKMLNEEIELWKWSFIQQVLDDVKQLLTLSVYSS